MTGYTRRLAALLPAAATVAALVALAGCGGSAPAAAPGPAPGTGATPPGSGVTTPVATAAPLGVAGPVPTPQEETYQGCPPQGDGGDAQLNVLKNRIDTGAWQSVSLQSLLALTWPTAVEKTLRSAWSASDAATVVQNEGHPVETEGYILLVRHEGPESPNCHDESQRDYHVWLAASPTDSRANAMIVELTPRVVARNPGWGDATNILRLTGHHVRISGWLLLDQEHPEQLHITRGTLWEIHPVMRVEVDQNGTWADLASGTVTLGKRPVNRAPDSTGPVSSPDRGTRRHTRHHRTRHTTHHKRRHRRSS